MPSNQDDVTNQIMGEIVLHGVHVIQSYVNSTPLHDQDKADAAANIGVNLMGRMIAADPNSDALLAQVIVILKDAVSRFRQMDSVGKDARTITDDIFKKAAQ